MQTFTISNLRIVTAGESADRICYILSPMDTLGYWLEAAAAKYGIRIAAISGMDWDNDLTPWPAPGEPPGSPDFRGDAAGFLRTLTQAVVPSVERRLGLTVPVERTLTGISLSGLFTLWQWMLTDSFRNIISLSGSFWYDRFAAWIQSQPVPRKSGRAYFLLGNQEAKSNVRAFRSVQTATTEIVARLRAGGIHAEFELVPGNHYQYGEERLNRSFAWMFGGGSKS